MRVSCSLPYALVAVFLLNVPNLGAQQITGRVLDQATGQPLAAVQVFIFGSGIGSLSQQNGRYLLLNVPAGTHTINAQRIGYGGQTAEVTVGAGETAVRDFRLAEQALGLDEIIVTGTPGGTQRRAIGNTVTSVSAAELTRDVAYSNAQNLLVGRTPGVQMSAATTMVGAGTDIQVRGIGTFTLGRNPLIYVDGIRVNNDARAGPQTGIGRTVNIFNDFNPAEIESIEIIKGPAAATLYGTEASAGVIQIITKRGQEGAPQFDVSIRQGLQYIRNPAGRIGTMYTCNNSFAPPCSEESGNLVPYNPYDRANEILDIGTAACARSLDDPQCWNLYWTKGPASEGLWPQDRVFKNGHSQTYDLGVRGGTSTVRYFLQASYSEDDGVEWYNYHDTFRGRANIGVVFSENFSLDVSTGYISGFSRFNNPANREGGMWSEFAWGTGYCIPTVSLDDNPCPRTLGFQEHLPTDHQSLEVTRDFRRFTGSATLNFNAGDWLSMRAIVGVDQGWDKNGSLYPVDTRQNPVYFRNYLQNSTGSLTIERPSSSQVTADLSATVSYDVTGSLSTATSVGAQYYDRNREEFTNLGQDFASPLSRTINQTPVTSAQIQYTYIENKSLGVYFQEQLGWQDRMFVTAAVRFDDNSAFGGSLDPEMYPKVSGTWVLSEENFWNIGAINAFRIRGAWGKAGRQPDTFASVNTFGVIPGWGGGSALNPTNVGNTEVGPEVGTEVELGFDYALFEDRFAGEFTWFSQRNEGALLNVTVPPSFGSASSVQRNIGRIDNWGWEATLNARLYESPTFSFVLALQGAHTMNEVKELGSFPGSNAIRLGIPYPNVQDDHYILDAAYDPSGPYKDLWGRKISAFCDAGMVVGGGDQADKRGQYGVVLGGPRVSCKDVGGYPLTAGPAFPTYTWSVGPRFTLFENMIDVSLLFDAAYGIMKRDDNQYWGERYNNSYDTRCSCNPAHAVGRSTKTRYSMGFFDGDFWKWREASVGVRIPESMAQMIGAERASLAFSMRELAILWMADDELGIDAGGESGNPRPHPLDPEMGRATAGGSGCRASPPSTSAHVTLKVTF